MSAQDALNARRNAEQWLEGMGDCPTDWSFQFPMAQAWALIAIAHELRELRLVLEARR